MIDISSLSSGHQSVWQNWKLPPTGAAGRRLLRHSLPRVQQVKNLDRKLLNGSVDDNFLFQFDSASGGAERDSSTGRGRRSVHGHPRGFSVARPAPRQRRHSARHRPHEDVVNVRLWIRRKSLWLFYNEGTRIDWLCYLFVAFRFGSVSGEASGRTSSSQCPSVPLPAPQRPHVRPPAQDPAQGPEAAEFAHQRSRRTQIGRFRWVIQKLWC